METKEKLVHSDTTIVCNNIIQHQLPWPPGWLYDGFKEALAVLYDHVLVRAPSRPPGEGEERLLEMTAIAPYT